MASPATGEVAAALRLDHVTKVFPGVRALDDVELTVRAGEVHGIVGENGAGKSTLMAVASGSLVPESGTVSISGELLQAGSTHAAQELGIAIVHQEPALLPDLTVAENMYLGVSGSSHSPPLARVRSWSRQKLEAWSPQVGIDPDSRIEELGAEQRFIVDIVRALAQEPAVLVLDEPTEHLAAAEGDQLLRDLLDANSGLVAPDRTVVVVTHQLPVGHHADTIVTVDAAGGCTVEHFRAATE